ncbi:hypothetical protein ACFFRR_008956 [Megaselia abdita]
MTLEVKAESFDRALELAQFGRFNVFLMSTAGIALANVYLESTTMNFVLPVSQCDLQWTQTERNLLGAVSYIGIIMSAHCWGSLADSMGRKKVLAPTLILGFVMSVLSSFCNSFLWMFTFRFFNGICISGATSVILVYLGEFHCQKQRDKSIMISCFILSIFALVCPLVAWGIINGNWWIDIPWLDMRYTPWRLFMVACATPGLISGFLIMIFPESPKYLLSKNQEEEALEVLKKIFFDNSRKDKSLYPVTSLRKDSDTTEDNLEKMRMKNVFGVIWNRTKPLFNKDNLKVTTILCTLQFILYSSNFGMFVFYPDIINSVEQHLKDNGNGTGMCDIYELKLQSVYKTTGSCVPKLELSTFTYSFICEILFFLGCLLLIFIITKIPKNYILAFVLAVPGVFGVVAAAIHNPKASLALYTALLTSALGMMVISSSVVESYPTHLRATAMSICQLFSRLGCVVGSNYIGSLLQYHCNMSFYISSIALIAGGLLALMLPKAVY